MENAKFIVKFYCFQNYYLVFSRIGSNVDTILFLFFSQLLLLVASSKWKDLCKLTRMMILANPSGSFLLWYQQNRSVERCLSIDFVHQLPWYINWPISCIYSCISPTPPRSLFFAYCMFCQCSKTAGWHKLILPGFKLSKGMVKPSYNAELHLIYVASTWGLSLC